MAFLYFPNGVQPDSWYPADRGRHRTLPEELSRVLEPLIPYRNDILLLGGLTNDGGRAKGDGPGDHGRAGAAYLTGMHPKKTFGKEIQAGVSIDQIVAQFDRIRDAIPLAELGLRRRHSGRQLRQRL